MPSHRHRGSSFNFTRVFGIVIGLHVVVGGGGLWLAKTQAGQQFARTYDIKLFDPPKPPEPEKVEEPPPPPPVKVEAPPPVEAPKVAAVAAPVAAAPVATVGGAGTNWGGKFAGAGDFDGPEGAFHAAVTGRFRKYYSEPPDRFASARLELDVGRDGSVRSFRLVKSSGSAKNDQAILEAAGRVKAEGLGVEPPESRGRIVTVNFVPSS